MAYEIYMASLADDLIMDLLMEKGSHYTSHLLRDQVRLASISHYFVSNKAELGQDFYKALVPRTCNSRSGLSADEPPLQKVKKNI